MPVRRHRFARCLALLALTVLLAAPAAFAREAPPAPWEVFQSQMAAEGWEQVAEGVFERHRGATKVERIGYGREGLEWMIGHFSRRLASLQAEYRGFPTESLADTIDDLAVFVARAEHELRNLPESLTAHDVALTGPSCTSICYSATADAFHLTSSQGVGAIASATFNSSCGFTGDTTAYAYARATAGTTTTTITQSDPKTGNPIASSATATVAGGSVPGITCRSEASASAISSSLGIAYDTSDVNEDNCPPPPDPPAPTISGTTFEFFFNTTCRSRTFTSSVSGGTAPFTYQWKVGSTVVGTGSSYTRTICPLAGSFTLSLTVTDASSRTGTDTHFVEVEYEPSCAIAPCP